MQAISSRASFAVSGTAASSSRARAVAKLPAFSKSHGISVPKRVARGSASASLRRVVTKASIGTENFDNYGKHCFRGNVAEKYLSKYGLKASILDTPDWTSSKADEVAAAVLDWAVDNGAHVFCHWFQPMGSGGVRHGQSGQVHLSMIEFDKAGSPIYNFNGETLLQGETDGSSYPNGGMRATHTAGGYLAIDPVSPIFLRGDTVFIPACFVSYNGDALDEKTPLHRAQQALSKEGTRLLKLCGYNVDGLVANIGLEQEFFLVPREPFYMRPDLQLAGRTVMGKDAARGQEMCDHYMGPISSATAALACIQQVQDEAFKMGIPLKTRHREVAPNQYEMAPLYGNSIVQTDQNLMIMQVLEETASKYGLAALLTEKPFANINGNGKHNNWSIGTTDGVNLLNPKQLNAASGNTNLFPIIMAAIVSGIDKHGDLMRLAIASPGNDFRLGAMEAPPAVMSTYLGEDMTSYLEAFANGDVKPYVPAKKTLGFGVDAIKPIEVPAEDRNRTSPFPYGGNRFEFRAVGSSQNVSLVNTVLNTLTAEGFKVIADRVEAGEDAVAVAQDLLKTHSKCIFNGNGYDPAWPAEAVEKGIWRIDSGVEAIKQLDSDKNTALMSKMGVFSPEECTARKAVLLEYYTGVVDIEALAMIDMIRGDVIPACKKAGAGPIRGLQGAIKTLEEALSGIHNAADEVEAAEKARVLRLETMVSVRELCDEAEAEVPADEWPFATYKELLFLDTHEH
mmetsp:Transcript_7259/g.26711  ORF Transcript_7259/g.26711 Transcript_7259/m.26711 type:complete len:737 (-) Transcript_7259:1365-3575(-)